MEYRFKIAIVCVAVVAAAVVAVLLLVQPPAEKGVCGDSVCSIRENWETCPQDCKKPLPTDSVEAKVAEIKNKCGSKNLKNTIACIDEELFFEANSKLDEKYCKTITSDEMRRTCVSQVLLKKATIAGNATECNKLEGSERIDCIDSYYYVAATLKNDANYCDNIITLNTSDMCHDELALERSIAEGDCRLLKSNWAKDKCAYRRAISENSSELCSRIIQADLRIECLAYFEQVERGEGALVENG